MKNEIKDFCKKHNITENQFFCKEEIGGNLDLESVTSLPDGFNPTVGGNLYLRSEKRYIGANIPSIKHLFPEVYTWEGGKYIKADGMFMEVIKNKGNVYRVRKINEIKESYLVTNGNGKWAHGSTLNEAKKDLIYKIGNRNKDDYRHLNLDSNLSFEESIEAYRAITGACGFGVRGFVESRLSLKKEKYKISEIISLTSGEYGSSDFAKFFDKK